MTFKGCEILCKFISFLLEVCKQSYFVKLLNELRDLRVLEMSAYDQQVAYGFENYEQNLGKNSKLLEV